MVCDKENSLRKTKPKLNAYISFKKCMTMITMQIYALVEYGDMFTLLCSQNAAMLFSEDQGKLYQ